MVDFNRGFLFMYDKYGFIVNYDRRQNKEIDQGDSCFYMGLQTLNFILSGQRDKAKLLYEKCKEIDFYRHPTIRDDTSYDMMIIWDFLANRFNETWLKEPEYHYRKSRFFWGKFRNKLMYCSLIGTSFLSLFYLFFKFSKKFRNYFLNYDNYYKLHLLILYFGIVYEKCKWNFFLKLLQNLVKEINNYQGYENYFFNFVAHLPCEKLEKPKENCKDWVYQRYNYNNDCDNRNIEFHKDKIVIDGKEIELDLSLQFYYLYPESFEKVR